VSLLDTFTGYRDRAYKLLNEFFPVQHSLDVLTGNDEDTTLMNLRAAAGLDLDQGPGDEEDEDDYEEDDDDESSDALGNLAGRAMGAVGKKKKARHSRGRGITARELRGFRKVTNLLRKVGMHPRGLGRSYARKRR
jgi:hypothetical protein